MTKNLTEEMPKVKRSFYTVVVKRILDIVLSGIAIIVLSPVMMILVILELIYHGRPVLFAQERPGLHGKIFKMYKFRSMTNETDENGELLASDQRLTSFGRFIRRFSLDELPELFCIFAGKMSVIGPRPLLVEYLPLYTKRHAMRHAVRPGLACIPLRPMKTWTWDDQFENDIWYVENFNFMIDFRMVFAVLKEAIVGAEYRVNDSREEFESTNSNKEEHICEY